MTPIHPMAVDPGLGQLLGLMTKTCCHCRAFVEDATELIDPTGKRMLEAFDTAILKDERRVDPSTHVTPYMDAELSKSHGLYIGFIRDLWDRNMIEFRGSCASIVTPFFCCKENRKTSVGA